MLSFILFFPQLMSLILVIASRFSKVFEGRNVFLLLFMVSEYLYFKYHFLNFMLKS